MADTTDDQDHRRIQRYALALPTRVEVKIDKKFSWNEITRLEDISAFGAAFKLKRPVKRGRLIMISLLGMNPTAAFPIMMGACAFLMPVASARFVEAECYHPQASLGLALGGVPAVLIAAFIVKSLPLSAVRWLVVIVVVYTATALLRSAAQERGAVPLAEGS